VFVVFEWSFGVCGQRNEYFLVLSHPNDVDVSYPRNLDYPEAGALKPCE